MNITLVNGTNEDPRWDTHNRALEELVNDLKTKGHRVDYFPIGKINLQFCCGCWDCWTKTPGLCRMKDDGPAYLKSMVQCDSLLFFSPLSAGFITSETKRAMDRFVATILPFIELYKGECHHKKRYNRLSPLLGIYLFDDGKINKEALDIVYENFNRVQLNMQTERRLQGLFSPQKKEEVFNEICSA